MGATHGLGADVNDIALQDGDSNENDVDAMDVDESSNEAMDIDHDGEEEMESDCAEGLAPALVDKGSRIYATLAGGGAAELLAAANAAVGCFSTTSAHTRAANPAGEGATDTKRRHLQRASPGASTVLARSVSCILRHIILIVVNGLACFVSPSPVYSEHVHCERY